MKELFESTGKMSSREVSELTGKRHDNVCRDIRALDSTYDELGERKVALSHYITSQNKEAVEYLLTRMQCFDLMTGYNLKTRIKVNRRWEQLELESKESAPAKIDFTDPENVMKILQAQIAEKAKSAKLEKQVAKLAPKAELMERLTKSTGLLSIGKAAKILKLGFGRNTLFKRLREMGVLFKITNEPKQLYIDRGYFEIKERVIKVSGHEDKIQTTTYVTQSGIEYLNKQFPRGLLAPN